MLGSQQSLVPLSSVYSNYWDFLLLQGDDSSCDRGHEGEGWQRWGFPLCCHAGCPGCGRAVQGERHHCAAHQAEGHGGDQVRRTLVGCPHCHVTSHDSPWNSWRGFCNALVDLHIQVLWWEVQKVLALFFQFFFCSRTGIATSPGPYPPRRGLVHTICTCTKIPLYFPWTASCTSLSVCGRLY